jgi:hypothetical protein
MTGYNSKFLAGSLRFSVLFLLSVCILTYAAGAIMLSPQDTSSSSSMIANGDPVSVNGIATGHPQNGLQVWLIGNNYLKVSTISVNTDNTYTYELTSAETRTLASGQYFVVIQHPMMNGQFDVTYDAATGKVTNRILGGGTPIFQMSGAGSLQSPASASALVRAISSQDIDDTFVTYSFFISNPTALIYPISDHTVGDRFTIGGSTNLAVGNELMVDITSASFKPTPKTAGSAFSGASGMVKVVPGPTRYNCWTFDVNTATFSPDEYIVTVKGVLVDVTGSTTFNLLTGGTVTHIPLPSLTIITTPVPTTTFPTPVPTTTPNRKSPLPMTAGIMALAIALIFRNH